MANSIGAQLNKLISSSNLIDVTLKSCSSDCFMPPKTIVPSETELNYDQDFKYIISEDKKILVCFIKLEAMGTSKTLKDKDGKPRKSFAIDSTFTLVYSVESEEEFQEEVYQNFTSRNAYYNAYAYLREMIHNLSSRMGLEPITLPLLKPITKKELEKELQKN